MDVWGMDRLTPFHNKKGKLIFPYRAILDRAFVWPLPAPEKIGKKQLIHIPEEFRRPYQERQGLGYLMTVGPGYQDDKGKWHPTSSELKPGMKVLFDGTVPWGVYVRGQDGREYWVVVCGVQDVKCIVA